MSLVAPLYATVPVGYAAVPVHQTSGYSSPVPPLSQQPLPLATTTTSPPTTAPSRLAADTSAIDVPTTPWRRSSIANACDFTSAGDPVRELSSGSFFPSVKTPASQVTTAQRPARRWLSAHSRSAPRDRTPASTRNKPIKSPPATLNAVSTTAATAPRETRNATASRVKPWLLGRPSRRNSATEGGDTDLIPIEIYVPRRERAASSPPISKATRDAGGTQSSAEMHSSSNPWSGSTRALLRDVSRVLGEPPVIDPRTAVGEHAGSGPNPNPNTNPTDVRDRPEGGLQVAARHSRHYGDTTRSEDRDAYQLDPALRELLLSPRTHVPTPSPPQSLAAATSTARSIELLASRSHGHRGDVAVHTSSGGRRDSASSSRNAAESMTHATATRMSFGTPSTSPKVPRREPPAPPLHQQTPLQLPASAAAVIANPSVTTTRGASLAHLTVIPARASTTSTPVPVRDPSRVPGSQLPRDRITPHSHRLSVDRIDASHVSPNNSYADGAFASAASATADEEGIWDASASPTMEATQAIGLATRATSTANDALVNAARIRLAIRAHQLRDVVAAYRVELSRLGGAATATHSRKSGVHDSKPARSSGRKGSGSLGGDVAIGDTADTTDVVGRSSSGGGAGSASSASSGDLADDEGGSGTPGPGDSMHRKQSSSSRAAEAADAAAYLQIHLEDALAQLHDVETAMHRLPPPSATPPSSDNAEYAVELARSFSAGQEAVSSHSGQAVSATASTPSTSAAAFSAARSATPPPSARILPEPLAVGEGDSTWPQELYLAGLFSARSDTPAGARGAVPEPSPSHVQEQQNVQQQRKRGVILLSAAAVAPRSALYFGGDMSGDSHHYPNATVVAPKPLNAVADSGPMPTRTTTAQAWLAARRRNSEERFNSRRRESLGDAGRMAPVNSTSTSGTRATRLPFTFAAAELAAARNDAGARIDVGDQADVTSSNSGASATRQRTTTNGNSSIVWGDTEADLKRGNAAETPPHVPLRHAFRTPADNATDANCNSIYDAAASAAANSVRRAVVVAEALASVPRASATSNFKLSAGLPYTSPSTTTSLRTPASSSKQETAPAYGQNNKVARASSSAADGAAARDLDTHPGDVKQSDAMSLLAVSEDQGDVSPAGDNNTLQRSAAPTSTSDTESRRPEVTIAKRESSRDSWRVRSPSVSRISHGSRASRLDSDLHTSTALSTERVSQALITEIPSGFTTPATGAESRATSYASDGRQSPHRPHFNFKLAASGKNASARRYSQGDYEGDGHSPTPTLQSTKAAIAAAAAAVAAAAASARAHRRPMPAAFGTFEPQYHVWPASAVAAPQHLANGRTSIDTSAWPTVVGSTLRTGTTRSAAPSRRRGDSEAAHSKKGAAYVTSGASSAVQAHAWPLAAAAAPVAPGPQRPDVAAHVAPGDAFLRVYSEATTASAKMAAVRTPPVASSGQVWASTVVGEASSPSRYGNIGGTSSPMHGGAAPADRPMRARCTLRSVTEGISTGGAEPSTAGWRR